MERNDLFGLYYGHKMFSSDGSTTHEVGLKSLLEVLAFCFILATKDACNIMDTCHTCSFTVPCSFGAESKLLAQEKVT